ncbi:hypothetical protein Acsp02_34150 [Actinoplanes sp. NBRC 103695]|nr:hypothetical protein Acsp02_34150 [Actinoplanes sp. NBRC 103695]
MLGFSSDETFDRLQGAHRAGRSRLAAPGAIRLQAQGASTELERWEVRALITRAPSI